VAYTGPAPSNAVLLAFITQAATGWNVDLAPLAHVDITLTEIDAVDLTSATGAVAAFTTSHAGTRAGVANAAGVAAMLNFHIARRYRGGKPRLYTPYLVAGDLTDEQAWSAAAQTALKAGWDAFIATLVATPPAGDTITGQVNVSYYQGFLSVQNPITKRWKNLSTPRVTPLSDVIVSTSAHARPTSQRRRNLN
jgi:hypothetical protein